MGATPKPEKKQEEKAQVPFCPLAMWWRGGESEDGTHLECSPRCAWWSEGEELCAVAVLAKFRPSGWWGP